MRTFEGWILFFFSNLNIHIHTQRVLNSSPHPLTLTRIGGATSILRLSSHQTSVSGNTIRCFSRYFRSFILLLILWELLSCLVHIIFYIYIYIMKGKTQGLVNHVQNYQVLKVICLGKRRLHEKLSVVSFYFGTEAFFFMEKKYLQPSSAI